MPYEVVGYARIKSGLTHPTKRRAIAILFPAMPSRQKPVAQPTVLGWREHVSLPALGLGPVLAKIDTGARTAALHALSIRLVARGGLRTVRFDAVVDETRRLTRECALPLHGIKRVKNSGGVSEDRYVIETEVEVGGQRWRALFTLTDRADMGYPVLLGRSTVRRRFLVDPSRSFLAKRAPTRPAKPPKRALGH